MNNTQTVAVSLDVTVSRSAWHTTYGADAATDVPDYILERARHAHRLVELAKLVKPGTSDGADVTLVSAKQVPNTAPDQTDWITLRVLLDVTVEATEWTARYGLPPTEGVGPHVAAELSTMPPLRDEIDATVIYVPAASGRLLQVA